MDNLRLLVVVVAVFIQSISAMDTQQFFAIASECKAAEKATDIDFINLKMNVRPKTETMKCLTACLFEKLGKIKNNKFDSEGLLKEVKSSPKFTEKLKKSVSEVMNDCKHVNDPDRCEFASKIADCLIASAAKRNIKKQYAV